MLTDQKLDPDSLGTDVRPIEQYLTHCSLGSLDAILRNKIFSLVLLIHIFRSYDNALR